MTSKRSRIFESVIDSDLQSWMSTSAPNITDPNCARAFEDLICETYNNETSEMWRLLMSIRQSDEQRVAAVDENAIVTLLDSCMVKGLDSATQAQLRENPTHDVVQQAYEELNTFLYSLRSKLDKEIQDAIASKSPSKIPLEERKNRRCHLM